MPKLNLNSWTPATAIIVVMTALLAGVMGYYAYHFLVPPDWVWTVAAALGGGGLYGLGNSTGANTVNGAMQAASDNAAKVVLQAHLATLEKVQASTPSLVDTRGT
jgi:hypothetical protein